MTLLSVSHLSVDYTPRGRTVHAVRDVSLTVQPGEVIGLAGESGSGKSTIAMAILRLIRPQEGLISQGRIQFEKDALLELSEEGMRQVRGRKIGMIFQDPFTSLNPVLRIREQMDEVLKAHAIESPDRVREVLDQVQLSDARILDAYPHQLSGGQRQRIVIATALLCRPPLLLADEPTTALDVLVQKSILDLLFHVQAQLKVAMIFISHNLSLMAQRTDRLCILKEGQLVEQGTTADVISRPQNDYTKALLEAAKRLHHV